MAMRTQSGSRLMLLTLCSIQFFFFLADARSSPVRRKIASKPGIAIPDAPSNPRAAPIRRATSVRSAPTHRGSLDEQVEEHPSTLELDLAAEVEDSILEKWPASSALENKPAVQTAGVHQPTKTAEQSDENAAGNISCGMWRDIPHDVVAQFINLDKRTDRRERFETMIENFMEPLRRCYGWKLERFAAAKVSSVSKTDFSQYALTNWHRRLGQIGAAKSHVGALQRASLSYPNHTVFIFEDDFAFQVTPAVFLQRANTAFEAAKDKWDVMMFGDGSYTTFKASSPGGIAKTKGAWCSEAYIVQPNYLAQLLPVLESGLQRMEHGADHVAEGHEPMGPAFDTLWAGMQSAEESNWYVFRPKIGGQRSTWGDSDVNR